MNLTNEEIKIMARTLYITRKLAGRPDYDNSDKNWRDAILLLHDLKKNEEKHKPLDI